MMSGHARAAVGASRDDSLDDLQTMLPDPFGIGGPSCGLGGVAVPYDDVQHAGGDAQFHQDGPGRT